MELKQSA